MTTLAESRFGRILASFEHQPIAANVREEWLRYLGNLNQADFAEALVRCQHQGGSRFANVPGRRPGIGEFASIVSLVRAERRRETTVRERVEDLHDPDRSRHMIDEIKRDWLARKHGASA